MRKEKALDKMNCALYLDDSSLLVGCQTGKIVTVDLSQGQVVREVSQSSCCLDTLAHVNDLIRNRGKKSAQKLLLAAASDLVGVYL